MNLHLKRLEVTFRLLRVVTHLANGVGIIILGTSNVMQFVIRSLGIFT